jgi:hypothetical protein
VIKGRRDTNKCAGILHTGHISYRKAISVGFGLDNFFSAIVTARADVVAQVRLTGRGLNRQRRVGQEIVCTVHSTFGWGLLILLNCHVNSLQKPIKI